MKKVIFILLFFSCCFSGTIIDVVKNFGNNHFGFYSGSPTTGTWDVGDMISDNSSGNIRIWYCTSKGTFGSYSNTGSTVNGSPHIYGVSATAGALIGQYVTLTAGFSAGQKKIIAKSSHVGSTTTGATSDGSSQYLYSVSNYAAYQLGDYVQVSKGWASTTAAYRVVSIDSVNQRLTLDVASSSAQTGITATPVRAITVDANATSTQATCNITQVSPTFKYFGSITDGKYQSGDTLRTGNASSYAQLDSVNGLLLAGNATVWDDIRIVPGSTDRPGTSDPSLVPYSATYLWEYQVNDSSTFTIQAPHGYYIGDTIYAHAHWTPGTRGNEEGTATVGWKVGYSWASIDSVFPAFSVVNLYDSCKSIDGQHLMTPEVGIYGLGKGKSSMILGNFKRTDTGTDDTWVGTASGELPLLLEIDFHIQFNRLGSPTR